MQFNVKLWATVVPGTKGLAADIFFKEMLPKYNTLISDYVQTKDGRRFWLRRMAEAIKEGFRIGMTENDTILEYDPKNNFKQWAKLSI